MLNALVTGALRFRMLLAGVAAGLIVLGAVSLGHTHNDVVPELASGPVLEVQTEALGLSSQEVEQYVTVPLENNLLDGIMNVWDVRSNSIPGLSSVQLYFEPGTTTLHARQLVEERLTNAFSLPNVSKPPQLIQPLSSSDRVLMIGLHSSSLGPLELSYLARWVVQPRVAGVQGVANVAIFGQQDRQIQVLVDPAKLAARHVSLSQIIDTAGNAQLVSPLSYLEGSSPGTGGFLDGPNQRLEIRPILPLGAPKDLATVPVADAPGRLPLGDVTTVVQSHQPMIGNAIVDGAPGLVLLVQKLPSASVEGVTKGVERALGDLRPALHGVQIDTSFFRPAGYVSDAIGNLTLALAIAAALALLAIAATLLDARSLAVAAASVAVSLALSAIVLRTLGYSLNALVVLGLLVAAAVVVDDAVGASHEIASRMRARAQAPGSEPIRGVVLHACVSLRSTLGYATLIALLSAAPVLFSKGLTATFLHPMMLAFAIAVLSSSAVALTITPALGMLLFERARPRHRTAALASRLMTSYELVLRRALALPTAALACVCAAGFAGAVSIPFLSEPSTPTFKDRNLVVQWTGPAGASLAEMDRITGRAVAELRALPSVSDVGATLGRAVSADQIVDTSRGQIFVTLKHRADYVSAVGQVRAIAEGTPGIRASVGTYESGVIGGVLASAPSDMTVRLYGEDYGQLRTLATQVQGLMSHVSGLGAPQVQLPAQEPNIEVAVNDGAALRAGVLPGDARRQASTLVSGLTVGNFFEDQAVFDVVVQGVAAVRDSVDTVRSLLIDTSGGGHVRLGTIARVGVHSDPIDIQHQALSRFVDVSAPVYSGDIAAAKAAVQAKLGQVTFPLQYHAEIVGGTPDDPTSHVVFLSYVLAAAIGVLLLLQAALRSWRLAALFFLALPVSLAGGLMVALAMGQWGSLGTDAGLLGVFAFAARQGMLQLAGIRRAHEQQRQSLTPAIVGRAASERFPSSLQSTITIAVALLPFVVIGDAAGTELTHVAAAVMLGGLASTLLLNLILLPAMALAFGPAEPVAAVDVYEEPVDAPGLTPTPSPS